MEIERYWLEEWIDSDHVRLSLRNHKLEGNREIATYTIAYYVGVYKKRKRIYELTRERMVSDDAATRSKQFAKISIGSVIKG